jgi:hypothetical protein
VTGRDTVIDSFSWSLGALRGNFQVARSRPIECLIGLAHLPGAVVT